MRVFLYGGVHLKLFCQEIYVLLLLFMLFSWLKRKVIIVYAPFVSKHNIHLFAFLRRLKKNDSIKYFCRWGYERNA